MDLVKHTPKNSEVIVPDSWFWNKDCFLKSESVDYDKKEVQMAHRWSGKWSHYGTFTFDRLRKDCIFIGHTEEEADAYIKQGKHLLHSGEGLELIKSFQSDEEPGNELMMQKDRVLALEKRAMGIANKAQEIQAQMGVAMAVMKNEMAAIMDLAKAEISKAMELVHKVQRIIRSIELYAGVNEDLVQIQEGTPALPEEPFVIRQAVIFMDEEVGQWREGGFDYSDVEKFDEWLKNPINLARVAPEHKCMVAFRPRRHSKDYGEKITIGDMRPIWNRQTYFLIRNGDNLYRIFTENLQLGEKVFLSSSDMNKLQDNPLSENDKDLFTRQALFIQGLIDRGEVLAPVPAGVNIFNPDTYQDWLRLIFDAEGVLTDGRLSFKDWKSDINKNISVGSRVVFAEGWLGKHYTRDNDFYMNERSKKYYNNAFNCPVPPYSGGLFIVESGFLSSGSTKWPFSFKYFPGGEGWSWSGYYERKNRVSFAFDVTDNVLNYDLISLEDVEYYMNDRVNRKDYAHMLPLLEKVRVERLAEIESEKDFVSFIAYHENVDKVVVWDLISWWKTKNRWKRPLRSDDTLALRMITKKIKSLKNKKSWN